MMKSLLGKNFSDPEVQQEIQKLPFKVVPLEDDHIGIEVYYDGDNRIFTPEHITAILLNHCCELAQKANKTSGKADVVISVKIPLYVYCRSLLSGMTLNVVPCIMLLKLLVLSACV